VNGLDGTGLVMTNIPGEWGLDGTRLATMNTPGSAGRARVVDGTRWATRNAPGPGQGRGQGHTRGADVQERVLRVRAQVLQSVVQLVDGSVSGCTRGQHALGDLVDRLPPSNSARMHLTDHMLIAVVCGACQFSGAIILHRPRMYFAKPSMISGA
jgi:hypothetical protein